MRVREARPTDAPAIARVHVDIWRTTYRGIVPDEVLANLSYAEREAMWTKILGETTARGFRYVAEDDTGAIVGFAAGGAEQNGDPQYTGQLYAVYLLAASQGQGVGWQLVAAVARDLSRQGFGSMLVWVLAANPARRFYEALGGQQLRTRVATISGVELEEVCYGWPDITMLVHGTR